MLKSNGSIKKNAEKIKVILLESYFWKWAKTARLAAHRRVNRIKNKGGEIIWCEIEVTECFKVHFRDLYENNSGISKSGTEMFAINVMPKKKNMIKRKS